jgi:hypothetical protein
MKSLRTRTNLQSSSDRGTGTLPSLIAVATFVLIIVSLYWAQAVLIPVALAILLTFLLTPVALGRSLGLTTFLFQLVSY